MRTVRLPTVRALVTTRCQHWLEVPVERGGVGLRGPCTEVPCPVSSNASWVMVTWEPILWRDRQTDRHEWETYLPVILLAVAYKTRMHSSRMRTACALTIGWGCTCPRDVPGWRGVPAVGVGGMYLPRGWGCTCPGVYLPGGVYLPRGVVPARGGVPARGVYLPRYSPSCEQNDR